MQDPVLATHVGHTTEWMNKLDKVDLVSFYMIWIIMFSALNNSTLVPKQGNTSIVPSGLELPPVWFGGSTWEVGGVKPTLPLPEGLAVGSIWIQKC